MNRLVHIDFLKGWAIFLMVIGNALIIVLAKNIYQI